MHAILTLAIKDLRLLWRDRVSLFWMLGFPLIIALFFGSLFGGGGGSRAALPVIVFDESSGEGASLTRRLSESDGIEVDSADSLEQAQELVRKGERVAFIHVRPGFTDGGFAMFARSEDDEALLAMGVDPSRTAERGLLQGMVTQALFGGMTEQISDPTRMLAQTKQVRADLETATELDPDQRKSLTSLMDALDDLSQTQALTNPDEEANSDGPTGGFSAEGLIESVDVIKNDTGRPRSPYDITFPSALVWALIGCSTAFATNMVRERKAGTLLRLRVSPLSRVHILAGTALACTIASLVTCVVLLSFGAVALGVRVGDPLLLLLAVTGAAMCSTGLMMIMSVLGKTEAAVSGGSWILLMPLAMIGGGMIPLIAMPPWLLAASNASPFKWAIYAIEGAIWRDFDVMQMLPALGFLIGFAVVMFGIGVAIMKHRKF